MSQYLAFYYTLNKLHTLMLSIRTNTFIDQTAFFLFSLIIGINE